MTAPDVPPVLAGRGEAAASTRVLGLDALRGLAILLMCLSGIVPAMLPNWMYHGYYPNYLPDATGAWVGDPANRFKFQADWSSFTWVDWVFPMFLFAMGAAIPLAFAGRRARGERVLTLIGHVLARWLLLIFFAVYVGQVTIGAIGSSSSPATLWLALLAFALPFAIFVRLPRETPPAVVRGIRVFGWVSCVLLLVFLATREGKSWSWGRHDIIILLLAHTFLVSAILWLLMPGRLWWLRLLVALPIMLLAHHQALPESLRWASVFGDGVQAQLDRLSAALNYPKQLLNVPAFVEAHTSMRLRESLQPWLNFAPLWDFSWYKFLWCVVPGTVVGDWLLRRTENRGTWTGRDGWVFAILVLIITLGLFVGLRHYNHPADAFVLLRTPWLTLLIAAVPALALAVLVFVGRERLPDRVGAILVFALLSLAAGLTLALLPWAGVPNGFFERGISKGPPATLSWYLLSNALSMLWLLLFMLVIDALGYRTRGMLVSVGQNPMLAYIAIRNLLAPLVTLPLLIPLVGQGSAVSLEAFVAGYVEAPWAGAAWALVKTLLLGAIVWLFTRRRIVWRA
jgi:hypothetical protein